MSMPARCASVLCIHDAISYAGCVVVGIRRGGASQIALIPQTPKGCAARPHHFLAFCRFPSCVGFRPASSATAFTQGALRNGSTIEPMIGVAGVRRMSGNPDKCRLYSGYRRRRAPDRLFDRHQALLDRELDELGKVADVELLHHARPVGFHGLRREKKRLRNDGAGLAFDEELQNLTLARAQ
jgi:hypothetical protein